MFRYKNSFSKYIQELKTLTINMKKEIVSILPNPWPIYLPLVLRTLRLLMHAFRSFHILRRSVAQIVTTSLRLNIIINGLNLLKIIIYLS